MKYENYTVIMKPLPSLNLTLCSATATLSWRSTMMTKRWHVAAWTSGRLNLLVIEDGILLVEVSLQSYLMIPLPVVRI